MNIFYELIVRIAHYTWANRSNLYSLAKKMKAEWGINFDGKVDIEEARLYFKLLKESGLFISPDDMTIPTMDEMVEALVWEEIAENPYKTLVQYDQSTNSCAIYGNTRPLMYNSWIILTRNEHEDISRHCIAQWYRKPGQGMYFKDACQGIKEWMLFNKQVEVDVIRTPYNGTKYKQLKELWYACGLGGWITKEKVLDIFDDGVVNANYTWNEKKMFGHCWSEEEIWYFTDNYPTRKKDKNQWENHMFDEFVKHGYSFLWTYFIIPKNMPSPEPTDYDRYLERGFIENPQPERVMTERLYGTFRERELTAQEELVSAINDKK